MSDREPLKHLLLQNNHLYASDKGDRVGVYANYGYQPVQLTRRDVEKLTRWLTKWLKVNDE